MYISFISILQILKVIMQSTNYASEPYSKKGQHPPQGYHPEVSAFRYPESL